VPSHIVRTARDSDLYCVWDDRVAAPTLIGTRREFEDECEDATPERLDRAAKCGTSALWPDASDPAYGYDQEFFTVMEGTGGPGTLRRDRLETYCRLLLTGTDEDADAAARLVEPFED
jgi:hypothetical protein